MIEVLTDVPRGVSGFRVSGRVSGDDMRGFTPEMETLKDAGEIRIVEVIDSDYAGLSAGGQAKKWAAGG